jgi:hypothetical protein
MMNWRDGNPGPLLRNFLISVMSMVGAAVVAMLLWVLLDAFF